MNTPLRKLLPNCHCLFGNSIRRLAGLFLWAVVAFTASSQVCLPPPAGLVAWWRAEGDGKDEIGNHDAALQNGANFDAAKVGLGFQLDGVDDRIVVADAPSLNVGSNTDFSIEGWIKAFPADTSFGVVSILDKRQTSNPNSAVGYALYLDSGRLSCQLDPGNGYYSFNSPGPNLQDALFHHVAVAVDRQSSTGGKLYVDGQLVYTFDPTIAAGDLSNPSPLRIGNHADASLNCFFKGIIDDICLYDRALSAGEIQAIYQADSAGKCPPQTPPFITSQPLNQAITVGDSASFTVGAEGTPPLSYQWRLNGTNLPGATTETLNLNDVQLTDAGEYSVVVSNAFGFTSSSNAQLTVKVPIAIGLLNINFAAQGLVKQGTAAIGQGSNDFWNAYQAPFALFAGLSNLKLADGAVSTVGLTVQNGGGHTGFSHLDLMYKTACYAQDFGDITLTVTNLPGGEYDFYVYGHSAANSANSVFQLVVGGNDYGSRPTATDASWSLTNWVEGAQYVVFRGVQVTNGGAPVVVKSHPGASGYTYLNGLQIVFASSNTLPPVILAQPESRSVSVGEQAQFTVMAGGTPPLSYQWRLNETNLLGATNAMLSLTNVQTTDAGNYSVLVSNAYGSTNSANASLTVAVPTCFPLPSGAVGWWRSEGDANDTVSGAAGSLVNGAGFAPGKVGQAFSFDGVNDHIRIPDWAGLRMTNAFSVEAWVYPSSHGAYHVIVSKWDVVTGPNQMSYSFSVDADGFFSLGLSATGTGSIVGGVTSTNVLPLNQWSHVCGTYDGTAISIYFNGAYQTQTAYSSGIFPGTNALAIGGVVGGVTPGQVQYPFAGRIDELGLYNRALSASEVQAIYQAGSLGKCAGPLPPVILAQPESRSVSVGEQAQFTVMAGGTPPLSYQWRLNETNLLGATNAMLSLTNVQTTDAGNYSVTITNLYGAVVSSNATLVVSPAPAKLRVVDTPAAGGNSVIVPVQIVATGNENALGFSLHFDPTVLSFSKASLGGAVTDALLFVNTNQTAGGHVGLAIALSTGISLSAGTQTVVNVTFEAAPVVSSQDTAIRFADQPTIRQISDTHANVLPADYFDGAISVAATEYEADVSPRPLGDKSLTITDWVQAGRFAAKLDTTSNGSEFQRADCAPRTTRGNGELTVTDWVQAGRYVAGLDPQTPAGGNTEAAIGPQSDQDQPPKNAGGPVRGPSTRIIRILNTSALAGGAGKLSIYLEGEGNENALGFSIHYDPTAASFVSAALGSGATGAILNVNSNSAADGQIGFVLALPTGSSFTASNRELITVTLAITPTAKGEIPVTFSSQPVAVEVSDPEASVLPADYVGANLNVIPFPPAISINRSGNNVVLSWPAVATNFVVQTNTALFSGSWGMLPITPTVNSNQNTITLPASGAATFYRLMRP